MAQRGKVGKSASNALRSYNRIISNVTEQCEKYRELSSVLGRNMKMAVVFSNKDGYIKYVGDKMFVDLIAEKCEVALLNDSTWEIEAEAENTERIVLPALPEPVSKLNAKDMQHIIPSVMRNLRGGGYIKWEREDNKPVWWPEDVVFANVKQRPEQQNSGDRWVDCLRKIVIAMYSHYGYDPEAHVDIQGGAVKRAPTPDEEVNLVVEIHEPLSISAEDLQQDEIADAASSEATASDDKMVSPVSHDHSFNSNDSIAHQHRTSTPQYVNATQLTTPHHTRDTILTSRHIRTPTTPHRETATPNRFRQPAPTTPAPSSPVILPLYLSGKRNWDESENDCKNSLPKKRRIKPRDIFTPSKYM